MRDWGQVNLSYRWADYVHMTKPITTLDTKAQVSVLGWHTVLAVTGESEHCPHSTRTGQLEAPCWEFWILSHCIPSLG